jgi:hypothetical protein
MDDGFTSPCRALVDVGQSGTSIKELQAVAVSKTIQAFHVFQTTSSGLISSEALASVLSVASD